MLFAWEIKHGSEESLRASNPNRHMHVYEHSYMAGRVGLAGLNLFAEECIRFDPYQERCGDQTCWFGSAGIHRKSGMRRRHAQEDDVECHQAHARFRQRIDGYECQRKFERRQRDDPSQPVLPQHSGYFRVFT